MKLQIPKVARAVKSSLGQHSPGILLGVGIALQAVAVISAVKDTPKAMRLIEAKEKREGRELTKKEVVQTTWKVYIPTIVSEGLSIACLASGHSISARRNAALMAACTLSESTLADYRAEVKDILGETKEEAIRDKIAQDKVIENPPDSNEVVLTGKGNTLFYEAVSGRYFESDIESVRRGLNNINREMMESMYISLNEFYDEIGMSHTSIGYDLGWCVDDGLIDIRQIGTKISEDGRPCIVLEFDRHPRYEYNRLY